MGTLAAVLRHPRKWALLPHAREQATEDKLTGADIAATLVRGTKVEINDGGGQDFRVLLRTDVRGRAVCLVASLYTFQVITVWAQACSDTHATLDTRAYTGPHAWFVRVADVLRGTPCKV